jgi:hypothetical protein
MDFFLVEEFAGDLVADFRFELVVLLQHRDGLAAEFAAGLLERQHEAVDLVLADHRHRSGQSGREADLDLGLGMEGGQGQGQRGAELFIVVGHACLLLSLLVQPRSTKTRLPSILTG